MKAKTAQAISVITLEDNQDAECILFVKMFLRFLHKNMGRVLLFAEDEDALVDILTKPKNALVKQYRKLFAFVFTCASFGA